MVSMNRLDTRTRARVVSALVEGNSIRSTVRMTGVAKNTITSLLVDLGEVSKHVWSIEEIVGLLEEREREQSENRAAVVSG